MVNMYSDCVGLSRVCRTVILPGLVCRAGLHHQLAPVVVLAVLLDFPRHDVGAAVRVNLLIIVIKYYVIKLQREVHHKAGDIEERALVHMSDSTAGDGGVGIYNFQIESEAPNWCS